MSRRALRRLRGEQRGQELLGLGHLGLEPGPEGPPPSAATGRGRRGPARTGVSNRFELIPAEELEDEPPSSEERADAWLRERDATEGNSEVAVAEETEGDGHRDGEEAEQPDQMPSLSNKPRKKKKKRKTRKTSAEETLEDNDLEDIDGLLEKPEDTNGLSQNSQSGVISDSRPLLYVEHRNLNPENELKRYFGARAVLGDQRPRQRQHHHIRSTWLTTPKNTWPRYSRTGMSMELLETRRGVQYFAFKHHHKYQQLQFKFLEAVESMNLNNIVMLLEALDPYHVDSLLQLSDVCRMREDHEMARDFIEQALYSMECTFHPVFSLTSGTCRLDYRRPENRSFFLALFKHLMFLEKRGCPRTALEFCKLILSLDPDNDPLCMLLMIDFLSLRAREYTFLTRMFQEWESHRNLSQLPNFAFSVPLAYFFLSQQEERSELELSQAQERAAQLIQLALIMFPSVLMPLLDHCGVQPDSRVTSHSFFGLNAQISQLPALTQLTSLYVERTHSLWKDPAVMAWLETHVHEVLRKVDAQDPLVQEAEHKRKTRYQSAPRNIYRHIVLSEVKEAMAALPLEVTSQPVMGHDPLPPLDSIISYTRPERYVLSAAAGRLEHTLLSVHCFSRKGSGSWRVQRGNVRLQSRLLLFGERRCPSLRCRQLPAHPSTAVLQEDIRHDGEEEAGAGQDLNQGVNRLMAAMRDMLVNIQFQEPPRDDNPEGDGDWD